MFLWNWMGEGQERVNLEKQKGAVPVCHTEVCGPKNVLASSHLGLYT